MTATEIRTRPAQLSIYDKHPELRRIPKEAYPKYVFLVLDGNSRWVKKVARGAIHGNPQDAETLRSGVEKLYGLFHTYAAENPIIDAQYTGTVQELFENFRELPIKDTVKQLDKMHVLPLIGHLKGSEVLETQLRRLRELPIDYVGAWGFSADNFARPPEEVAGLMWLFEQELANHAQELKDNNSRFIHLGDKSKLPTRLQDKLATLEEETAENSGQTFCLAVGFGGLNQVIRVGQQIIDSEHPRGTLMDASMLEGYIDGNGSVPLSADLIILPGRWQGLPYTSDLGLLNGKGTKLYFPKVYWPDTTTDHLVKGVIAYTKGRQNLGGRPDKK